LEGFPWFPLQSLSPGQLFREVNPHLFWSSGLPPLRKLIYYTINHFLHCRFNVLQANQMTSSPQRPCMDLFWHYSLRWQSWHTLWAVWWIRCSGTLWVCAYAHMWWPPRNLAPPL
jgi:hypothetical protein